MPVFELNKPIETEEPFIKAEGLEAGTHVFELKVVDEAGNISLPAAVQVKSRVSGPAITSFDPEFGYPGDKVIVWASGIDPDLKLNKVMFDGIPAEVTGGSTRTLHVLVPEKGRTGELTIANKFGQGCSDQPFIIPEMTAIGKMNKPLAMCFSHDGLFAAVADTHPESDQLGRIHVVDLKKSAAIKSIELRVPVDGLIPVSSGEVFELAAFSSRVPRMTFVNLNENTVTASIPLPLPCVCAAMVPGRPFIYAVLSKGDGSRGSLVVIDIAKPDIINSLPLGTGPHALAMNAKTGLSYVTNARSGSITLINLKDHTLIKSIKTGPQDISSPVAVSSAPDTATAWFADASGGAGYLLDDALAEYIKLGEPPSSIHGMPDGKGAFAAGRGGKYLFALSRRREQLEALAMKLSSPAAGSVLSALTPDGTCAMVLHPAESSAGIFDARTLRRTIILPLQGTPEKCYASPNSNLFGILCPKEGRVLFVRATSVV